MARHHPNAPLTVAQRAEFYRGKGRELEKLAGSVLKGLEYLGDYERLYESPTARNDPAFAELHAIVACAQEYVRGVLHFFETQTRLNEAAGISPVDLAGNWYVKANGELSKGRRVFDAKTDATMTAFTGGELQANVYLLMAEAAQARGLPSFKDWAKGVEP